MSTQSIPNLVEELISSCNGDITSAAHRMHVSVATLSRWRNGQSKPQPSHEILLKDLAMNCANTHHDHTVVGTSLSSPRLQRVENTLLNSLSAIRELFHSQSHFSSQHDCLDFIASLFFAHVKLIEEDGRGLSKKALSSNSEPADTLNNIVSSCYRKYTRVFDEYADHRFQNLNLQKSDDNFALSVAKEIEKTTASIIEAQQNDREDILNAIFSRFLGGSFVDEKELGQYLTPPEIVDLMTRYGLKALATEKRRSLVDSSEIKEAGLICDPSCGVGSFLGVAAQVLSDDARATLAPEEYDIWLDELVKNKILGIDKSMRMAHLATTNMALFGAGEASVHRLNALNKAETQALGLDGACWLILTNPPFGAEYSAEEVSDFEITKRYLNGNRSVVSEILFIERYMDWLAPGGVLVSIVPDNILTGKGLYAELRKYIAEHADLLSVVSLPAMTFSAAGTSTKTSILTLRKKSGTERSAGRVYFGVCNSVGYDVVTRGGYRRRRPTLDNDLPSAHRELCEEQDCGLGRWIKLAPETDRWDAIYHAHPSLNTSDARVESENFPMISDLAELVDNRRNPKRVFEKEFLYIEISDIDAKTGWVSAKSTKVGNCPSRARKLVQAGDVLVSTVRPERGAVGVVPDELDGAICSTGLAVLRPKHIDAHVLRRLLVSRSMVGQMERHNVGITYPAISERDLVTFRVPLSREDIDALARTGREVAQALKSAAKSLSDLDSQMCSISESLAR